MEVWVVATDNLTDDAAGTNTFTVIGEGGRDRSGGQGGQR